MSRSAGAEPSASARRRPLALPARARRPRRSGSSRVAKVLRRGIAAGLAGTAVGALALGVGAFAAEPRPAGVAPPLPPSTNPTTDAKVALGAKLFADVRLSVDDKLACATCHVAELAFTDGHARARGHGGKELGRNSPTLLNAALHTSFFHDGRAPSLEEQARVPILHPDEMAMPSADAVERKLSAIAEYPPLFAKAFGDRRVTLQRVARAIAAFERTLVTGDSPFDRWWRGDAAAMSDAAKRGHALFVGRAGCSQCHSTRQSYAHFTDGGFHNTGAGKGDGLADRGRAAVTGRREDEGAFRTPGLRNVALTAPYMHDGSLATLEDVVDFYVEGGRENPNLSPLIRPLELTDDDRGDLVAFLRALTSPVRPQLEECDRLLAEGRPREAFDAFRRDLDSASGGDRALLGMSAAAQRLGERGPLLEAERRLRVRLREASPDRGRDGDDVVQPLLSALADVTLALAPLEEAMALAREDDVLVIWRRMLAARPDREDVRARMAGFLLRRDRLDEALELLPDVRSPELRCLRATVTYRRGWRGFADGAPTAGHRSDLSRAAAEFDALHREGARLDAESLVCRATARHWLGESAAARAAYVDAARVEAAADRALRGLRNLLAKDPEGWRRDLAALAAELPDSPAVLYISGWEALEQGDDERAGHLLRRRLEVETEASPGTHLLLARVERRTGRREQALAHYAVALALDERLPGLVAEYESYVRERPLRGFDDVDALVAETRAFLDAGPDDPKFQALSRNNLAFTLRDVAASYASRGPARTHTFPRGAPEKAREVLRLSLRLYEEAAALLPDDADELPFSERWLWAGVMNDLGLMLHYFEDTRDLARAERCYLKAFDLTGGAYMDAYFYNLQFLYGFELTGRDEEWLALAAKAKDAILREDPASPTGFSPDRMKRDAARRDWERLSARPAR